MAKPKTVACLTRRRSSTLSPSPCLPPTPDLVGAYYLAEQVLPHELVRTLAANCERCKRASRPSNVLQTPMFRSPNNTINGREAKIVRSERASPSAKPSLCVSWIGDPLVRHRPHVRHPAEGRLNGPVHLPSVHLHLGQFRDCRRGLGRDYHCVRGCHRDQLDRQSVVRGSQDDLYPSRCLALTTVGFATPI